ncbi:hypothetical protein PT274_01295 [Leuconostocaceae bacterium ESL0958]|nr:hypothetical protein [Leuconostocaceae bacterium ESL0958]
MTQPVLAFQEQAENKFKQQRLALLSKIRQRLAAEKADAAMPTQQSDEQPAAYHQLAADYQAAGYALTAAEQQLLQAADVFELLNVAAVDRLDLPFLDEADLEESLDKFAAYLEDVSISNNE